MKILKPIGVCLVAVLGGWLVVGAYPGASSRDETPVRGIVLAQNACVQICQATLRSDVQSCNYPQKEIEELTRCLATARANFDACRQGC
jgi:hypothetical protein